MSHAELLGKSVWIIGGVNSSLFYKKRERSQVPALPTALSCRDQDRESNRDAVHAYQMLVSNLLEGSKQPGGTD